MSRFKDADSLDRVATIITGVAGVAGATSGGAAVWGALLAAALAGKAALQGRLDGKSSDASHVIGVFTEQFKDNWDVWSELKSRPEDLQSAALSFEEYFRGGDSRSIPSAELIIAQGHDAEKITRVMLLTASEYSPNVYSNTPINAINRRFFTNVIQSALSHLIETPAFVDTLQPAFQKTVMEDLSDIKEGVDELHNKFEEQVAQWQTKEQYEKQLHSKELDLQEKEIELRLTVSALERSESRTAEEQEKYSEANAELFIIEKERATLYLKLSNLEDSHKATDEKLNRALSKLPEHRLEQARAKLTESPIAVADEISIIVEEEGASLAAAAYEAANLYEDQIQYIKALNHYKKAAVLNDQNMLYLDELATMHRVMGQYAQAEPMYDEALKIKKKRLGNDHLSVASSLSSLALLYKSQGRYDEAEPLYVEAMKIREKQLGDDNPFVAITLHNLASLYNSQGNYDEAEPLFVKALTICKKHLGDEHAFVANSLNGLASLYKSQGNYDEAEPLFLESLEIRKKQLGDEHPEVATSLNNLGGLYNSQGKYDEAEPLFLESLEIRKKQLGDEHPDVANSLNNLASVYKSQGCYGEAEKLYLESLEIRKKMLSDEHPNVAISLSNLAMLYKSQGRHSEAEPLLLEALDILENSVGVEHPDTITVKANYEHLQEKMNKETDE